MKRHKTQVLIIGSGLAGLTAAIRLLDQGINVTVLSKKGLGKASNTAMSMAAFSVLGDGMTKEEHYKKTLKTGDHLNDEKLVKTMLDTAGEAFDFIKSQGLPLSKTPNGYKVESSEAIIPGAAITDILEDRVKAMGAKLLSFTTPIELVKHQGRCRGVLAINSSQTPVFVEADQVLLCTGGFAGAVSRNDNSPHVMGEGIVLAYRAGAKLRDLEFIQYYPFGFYEEELPQFMVLDSLLSKAKLYNDKGENLLQKYLGPNYTIKDAIMEKRDVLSLSLEKEWRHNSVWLDITERDEVYQGLYSSKFDFNNNPFRVRPICHFTMGGVIINTDCETDVPGLYAAGEVTGGVHGSNRLGGNALTEALTFGYIAANSIVKKQDKEKLPSCIKVEEIEYHNPILSKLSPNLSNLEDSSPKTKEQIKEVKQLFWKGLNPIRDVETLEEVLNEAKRMWEDIFTNAEINKNTFLLEHTLYLLILTTKSALETDN